MSANAEFEAALAAAPDAKLVVRQWLELEQQAKQDWAAAGRPILDAEDQQNHAEVARLKAELVKMLKDYDECERRKRELVDSCATLRHLIEVDKQNAELVQRLEEEYEALDARLHCLVDEHAEGNLPEEKFKPAHAKLVSRLELVGQLINDTEEDDVFTAFLNDTDGL